MQQNLYIEKVRILYTTINIKFYLFNFYFKKSRAIIIKGKNIFFILILLNFTIVPYCYNKGIILNPKEQLIEQSIGSLIKLTKKLQDNSLNETSGLIENLEIKAINNQTTQKDHNSRDPSSLTPKNAYAIVVGIADYPGSSSDLSYTDNDANDVYSLLINDYNFKPENVIYLQDSSAGKSEISNAFDQIASQISEDDIFFFYYSGHGGLDLEEEGPFSWDAETPHSYSNNYDHTWSVSHPGAIYMRVHFYRFDCEYYWDYALCGDSDVASGWYYEMYSGDYGYNFWSAYIPVNEYYIRFKSDDSITDYGFKIDSYEALLPNGTHYLCSYDCIPDNPDNYYLDTLLDSKLDNFNCAEKYIVMDSCFSGGMIPEVEDIGRYIMSACDDNESSLESPSLQHGVFSYYFLRSLDYANDANEDGVKSMEECFSYTYSNTVSYSGSLGYTHHPQEYDGITGESVLYPSFGSVSYNLSGNELSYNFTMYGTGLIEELNVGICFVSQEINFEIDDLLENPASETGFGNYSGIIQLEDSDNITSYGIVAEIRGNNLIKLNDTLFNDTDSDGLDDIFEIMNGLNPILMDTDIDGLSDGEEYYGDSDPLLPDTDYDGLLDGLELNVYNTDFLNPDTDGDGIYDGYEVNCYLNPLINDSYLDSDNDGLSNLLEFQLGSNANNTDSDGDGITDGYEVFNSLDLLNDDADLDFDNDGLINILEFQIGSSANNTDSDFDQMPDFWEYNNGLNLIYNDAQADLDNDGLNNYLEFQIGSSANNTDSDFDQMPDYWEYNNNLNLTYNDTQLDPDNDGLINIDEYLYQTDPQDYDTDGDLYSDGIEVLWGTDPLNPLYSLNSIFLNLAGITLMCVLGYYTFNTVIKKNLKIIEKEKLNRKFKINQNTINYNSLRVETKVKPIPVITYKQRPPYSQYAIPSTTSAYTPSTPYERISSYGIPSNLELNKMRIIARDFIQNKLPPPKPSFSSDGQRAMQIAMASLKLLAEGRIDESIKSMILALQLGVPEPINSQIKRTLLNLLDQNIDNSTITSMDKVVSHKKCMWCGTLNKSTNNFCIKCGRSF